MECLLTNVHLLHYISSCDQIYYAFRLLADIAMNDSCSVGNLLRCVAVLRTCDLARQLDFYLFKYRCKA